MREPDNIRTGQGRRDGTLLDGGGRIEAEDFDRFEDFRADAQLREGHKSAVKEA